MSRQLRVVNAGVFGTSIMTIFSYWVSRLSGVDTREPDLLAKLIHRLPIGISGKRAKVAGWAAHYAVGLLFAELYGKLWERHSISANAKSGLVFGGLSGVAAILIWRFTFAVHPFSPAVNFKKFAVNLFFAHVVFGLFAAIGYKL